MDTSRSPFPRPFVLLIGALAGALADGPGIACEVLTSGRATQFGGTVEIEEIGDASLNSNLDASVVTISGCTMDGWAELSEEEFAALECAYLVRAEEAVRILSEGSKDEKLAMAELSGEYFHGDWDNERCDASGPRKEAVVRALRSALRSESDDWLLREVLRGIATTEEDVFLSVFRDALRHSSPNVRLIAVQWLAEVEGPDSLPLLERAWREERRSWIRAPLMSALAWQGASSHARELFETASDDGDLPLAVAAVEALTELGGAEVEGFLGVLSLQNKIEIRRRAIDGLARSDTTGALDALLAASFSEEPEIRARAVDALGDFDDPRARARVDQATLEIEEPLVLDAAIHALARAADPQLPVLVARVLEEAPSYEARLDAFKVLRFHDRGLSTFNPRCSFRSFDQEQWSYRWALPPEGLRSVRCYAAPGVADVGRARVPRSMRVTIGDSFERDGTIWLEAGGCWIPEEQLAPRTDDGRCEATDGPGLPTRVEIDVLRDDLDDPVAQELLDSGVLEVIDPAEDVVGIALYAEPFAAVEIRTLLDRLSRRSTTEAVQTVERVETEGTGR